ncbi:membrane protein [Candidatus Thiomargarita nelsonii]|uniref:Membrane protein n=1 Tax=Candidatus Thiomargarita nelsonii TaxID=1003181 RepID=A0A0A6P2H6_9GAMM|nr:membrane protein [Candidatus Thiomargarita nelsonii]
MEELAKQFIEIVIDIYGIGLVIAILFSLVADDGGESKLYMFIAGAFGFFGSLIFFTWIVEIYKDKEWEVLLISLFIIHVLLYSMFLFLSLLGCERTKIHLRSDALDHVDTSSIMLFHCKVFWIYFVSCIFLGIVSFIIVFTD